MTKISSKQFQAQTKFAVSNYRMMINFRKQGMIRLRKKIVLEFEIDKVVP